MRATLALAVFSTVAGTAWAQPLNEAVNGLESCFQQARLADSICSKGVLNAAQRQDCFQKARDAQLECLEHVQQEMTAGSKPPQQPSAAASPQSPATIPSRSPAGTGSAAISATPQARMPAEQPDSTTGAVSPDRLSKDVKVPATSQDSNWVISETTSPIDYSPLATATIHSTFSTKDAPQSMMIRCRQSRTELLLRTEGTWRRSPTGDVPVEYRIDTQPPVISRWASVDVNTAIYKGDAVGLLQSLGDNTRIRITLSDRAGSGQSAMFQLAGLDAVRARIGAACKWASGANRLSSGRR
jgi:Type VI secretion system VasI, EvfG, VC_A0118